jgi:hypothetical protein
MSRFLEAFDDYDVKGRLQQDVRRQMQQQGMQQAEAPFKPTLSYSNAHGGFIAVDPQSKQSMVDWVGGEETGEGDDRAVVWDVETILQVIQGLDRGERITFVK